MSEIKKRFVTWFELTNRCRLLADLILANPNPAAMPDVHLVAIGSGGWIPTRLISGYLQQKGATVYTSSISVRSYEDKKQKDVRILSTPTNRTNDNGEAGSFGDPDAYHIVIDDLVDSGDTMDAVWRYFNQTQPDLHFDTAVVYNKPHSLWKPTYFGELVDSGEWVVFPYETEDLL